MNSSQNSHSYFLQVLIGKSLCGHCSLDTLQFWFWLSFEMVEFSGSVTTF